VEVAVLVYGYGLVGTGAEYSFCLTLMGEVDAHAAILCLHIDECDVVILSHGVRYTAHLYLDMAIIDTCHHGEMLLYAGVNGVHGEFLHLLATAYDGNLRVYHLLDYITTMLTFEKSY
jgi:hypothetical protein